MKTWQVVALGVGIVVAMVLAAALWPFVKAAIAFVMSGIILALVCLYFVLLWIGPRRHYPRGWHR